MCYIDAPFAMFDFILKLLCTIPISNFKERVLTLATYIILKKGFIMSLCMVIIFSWIFSTTEKEIYKYLKYEMKFIFGCSGSGISHCSFYFWLYNEWLLWQILTNYISAQVHTGIYICIFKSFICFSSSRILCFMFNFVNIIMNNSLFRNFCDQSALFILACFFLTSILIL